jgi:hypothetical protein
MRVGAVAVGLGYGAVMGVFVGMVRAGAPLFFGTLDLSVSYALGRHI